MHTVAQADAHQHPTPPTYLKVAATLFVLTFLEVGAYEVARRAGANPAGLIAAVALLVVPIILVLSAAKFALVAAFYMHLKSDGTLLSGLFIFALVIAAVVVVALLILFGYLYLLHPTAMPK